MRPIVFSGDQAQAAADEWGFNCGPAAICAVMGMTPEQLRPHLGDFEKKRYTNPNLMKSILESLDVEYTWKIPKAPSWQAEAQEWPIFGLARIQWDGPWCAVEQRWMARQRHTHWVACSMAEPPMIFDVNAVHFGGWRSYDEWSQKLVPWLLKQCVPNASGRWWITHSVEVVR